MRPYTVYIMPKHFIDKMAHKCSFLLLRASLKMLQSKLSDECKGTIFFPCVLAWATKPTLHRWSLKSTFLEDSKPLFVVFIHRTGKYWRVNHCFILSGGRVWINLGGFYVESAVMFLVSKLKIKNKKKIGGLYKMYKCSTSHHIKAMFPVMFYAKSSISKCFSVYHLNRLSVLLLVSVCYCIHKI